VKRYHAIALAFAAACASPPPPEPTAPSPPAAPPALAAKPPADPLADPPPAGITPSMPFPPVTHAELDNGLDLAIVARRGYPVIDIRLVVRSGQATDAERPGVAALAGDLLKDGGAGRFSSREIVERAETLGGSLAVSTDRDSTRIGISVTSGDLDPALEIVSALVNKPRFSPEEFEKLKAREVDRVKGRSRTSPSWLASMMLYRELYELPTSVHPYARYDALPEDIAGIRLEDAKRWAKTHVVPENATLVVTGDVDASAVTQAAQRWFGAWRGTRPAPPSFSNPFSSEGLRLFVVDRPSSAQSLVLVGVSGPERKSADYPALMAANQVLGGGVAGRLFLDVREKRSLAYSTGSSVEEPANGGMPLVLSAGTRTEKTAEAVEALLENLERIGTGTPTQEEVERATRFLSDSFLFKMETAGALADLTARLVVLGLADEAYDEYRRAVRDLAPESIAAVASRYYKKNGAIVVVAGDAAVVAKPLTRIAAVKVIDPEKFTIRETLPKK
jgi:predicted Zn-dependent peptidase